jgi:hypothetical protein
LQSKRLLLPTGGAAIERLFVELFLAHATAPSEIVLDLDAINDPVHGEQEGRFFFGYYGGYWYLPLYVFCGRHLLAAKLRPANIDGSAGAREEVERIVGQIRARWHGVKRERPSKSSSVSVCLARHLLEDAQ